jgi:hypothetical protein
MPDHFQLQTPADPLFRLRRDLEAVGRIALDRVPAHERVEEAIGPVLFDVVRRSLLAPAGRALPRPRRVA